jgi:hypothetical protein
VALTRLPTWFTRRVSSFHRNLLVLFRGRFLGRHKNARHFPGHPVVFLEPADT